MEDGKKKVEAYEADKRDYKEKKDRVDGIQTALTQFGDALYSLQQEGIISGNGKTNNLTGLTGSNTREDPYSPMRVDENGPLPVETLFGERLVDKELAQAGSNYISYCFAKYPHAGIDIAKKGEYIASVAGTLTLKFDNGNDMAKGIQSILSFGDNEQLRYAHNGAEVFDAFINAWGQQAQGITQNGTTYSLGVVAGTVIGYTGLTGATSGYHLHLVYTNNPKGDPVDPFKFYKNRKWAYITDDAQYLTGYARRLPYNNPGLIANIVAYNKINTKNFPMTEYIKAHPNELPVHRYNPNNGRVSWFNPKTGRYEIVSF